MKKRVIVLIVLSILFIILSILVSNNLTYDIDHNIYKFLISFKSSNLTSFFKIVTKLANVKWCIIIVLISMIIFKGKKKLFLFITAFDVEVLNLILKLFFKRERPQISQLVKVTNYSYPSGHAMISMGIYGCLIYMTCKYIKNKKLKYMFVCLLSFLIILIGLSRIYLGVHHATDIIAGYIVSIIYLIIFDKAIEMWGDKNV